MFGVEWILKKLGEVILWEIIAILGGLALIILLAMKWWTNRK